MLFLPLLSALLPLPVPSLGGLPELPAPKAPIAIAADAKLIDVLGALADQTGQALVVDRETRALLETSETGLLRDTKVPAELAWTYVESLLAFHGAICSFEVREVPTLVAVRSRSASRAPASAPVPLFADVAQLGWFERHPAFLGRASLELPNTDVRQLVNSLRAVQTPHSGYDSLINAGQTQAIVITGSGAQIVQTVQLLQLVDRQSAAAAGASTGAAAARGAAPAEGAK
jgi:hypothetical protein